MNSSTIIALIMGSLGGVLASSVNSITRVPTQIYYFFKRQFTVTCVIRNDNALYNTIEDYINHYYPLEKFRILKGRFNKLSIGESTFFLKFENKYMVITSYEDRQTHKSSHDTHGIKYYVITTLGRNHDTIKDFVQKAKDHREVEYKDKVRVTEKKRDYWWDEKVKRRPMSSVIMDKTEKEKLVNHIRWFLDNEAWYDERCIPYRLGILLYGPPGTGKSSLIRVLATEFNLPINNISDFNSFNLHGVETKSINVIEDIDSYDEVKERDPEYEIDGPIIIDQKSKGAINIANILNILDGIASKDNYLIIATTNHIDKLDQALIRPGRFDIKIELGYIDMDMLKEYIEFHYKDIPYDLSSKKIKPEISASILQQKLLEKYTLKELIDFVCIDI